MRKEIFHLTIKEVKEAGGNRFSVYAESAEAEAQEVEFATDAELTKLLTDLHERGPLGLVTYRAHELVCIQIGTTLFNKFFVPPVLRRFQAYRSRNPDDLRLALHISPSLYYLPWEVLRESADDKQQFLAFEGSIIRYDVDTSQPEDTLFADRPSVATLLFLLSSPEGKPQVGPFEPLDMDSLKYIPVNPAVYTSFGKALKAKQPYGLVFFGHGEVKGGNGHLLFVQEARYPSRKVYPGDLKAGYSIGTTLGSVKKMRLAYILACESAWAGNSVAFRNSVIGSILLYTNLAYVIGAQTPIGFFAAREFFTRTVEAMIEGSPLDLAITEGRKTIRDLNPEESGQQYSWRDWWVPVLYAKTTDFDLFPQRSLLTLPGEALAIDEPEVGGFFGALKRTIKRDLFAERGSPADLL